MGASIMPTVADRNNNPGNLRDPKTGSFRTFSTPQEGYAALLNDLETKKTGQSTTGLQPGHTLADFSNVYAPKGDNNNPAQYTANIANYLGVRPDTPISQLDTGKWAEAIAHAEGYSAAPKAPTGGTQQDQSVTPAQNEGNVPFPAAPNDTPIQAGAKAVGNLPSSIFNLGKGLVNLVTHPIDTTKGIFNTVAGGAEHSVRVLLDKTPVGNINFNGMTLKDRVDQLPPDQQEATFNAVADAFKKRYGSLEAAQQSATNDPAGVGADILSVLEGGAGLTGKTAQLESALNTGTAPFRTVGKGILSLPGKVATETLGIETGVGSAPIRQGFQAAKEGGTASQAFTDALRGRVSPDELVNSARDALGEVVTNRSKNYQDMLKTLGSDKTTYDISPITNELDTQLKKFNISRTSEGLDFSRSKFALDPTGQKDIEKLVDYVESYGLKQGDRTALGIDNLKQVLGGYFSPNSDYRAFVQGLKGATRKVLESAPGYSEAMKNYSDMSEYIKDIQQSLSLGDKAMVETSFKKLTSSLKNNDFRQQVLQSLDKDTGGQLMNKIAGQRLSPLAPRGLAQYTTTGIGGVIAATQGGILPLLGIAMTSSPRVVGEFVRALGIGARRSKQLMDVLNKFTTPAAVGGTIQNRIINPAAQ